MEIIIRQARQEDYAQLCDLFEQVDALHRQHLPQLFQRPEDPPRDEAYLLGLMSDEQVGLFVAEIEGEVVGFAHVVIGETRPIPILVPRRYAVVENLAVKEAKQRSGIGRALMQQAATWASSRGASTLELSVYEFNQEAIAFYESLGYQTLNRHMALPL